MHGDSFIIQDNQSGGIVPDLIVRSAFGRFSSRESIQRLCAEEARAGWGLGEKFDDSRVRFRRRIERSSQDQTLNVNPYRTNVGIGEGGIALVVVALIAAVALAALLLRAG